MESGARELAEQLRELAENQFGSQHPFWVAHSYL